MTERPMTERDNELDRVRRRVVNVVGHELRTPLTTIRGLADLLADASDEELRTTLIPALVRNARRTERLLDNLLLASGVDTVRPTDGPTAVPISELVEQTAAAHECEVEAAPPATVLAHRDTVVDALEHLATNAQQYGDGRPTFTVEPGDQVTVTVITPVHEPISDLDLAFELFYRGESAVTRAAGLGLGLPLARALARSDGGDVTIEQRDGVVETCLVLPGAS